MDNKKHIIIKPEPGDLMRVSLNACTVMTNEKAEAFFSEFARIFCYSTVLQNVEKFSGNIRKLKVVSKCGKYRTGAILKHIDSYLLITDIVDTSIFCVLLDERDYNKLRNFNNWNNQLPLSLGAQDGKYSRGVLLKSYDSGIIDNTRSKKNIDNEFKFIEELPYDILSYLIPEIYLRGDTKYEEI